MEEWITRAGLTINKVIRNLKTYTRWLAWTIIKTYYETIFLYAGIRLYWKFTRIDIINEPIRKKNIYNYG